MAESTRRSLFRFSIQTMLLTMGAIAVVFAYERHRSHARRDAIDALVATGADVGLRVDISRPIQLRELAAIRELPEINQIFLRTGSCATDEAMAHFGAVNGLELLQAPDGNITDAGVASLASLTRLRRVVLTGNKIRGRAFEGFDRMRSLTDLLLDWNPIDNDGLAAISRLPALQVLTLGDAEVDDDGVALLRNHPTLIHLTLGGSASAITDAALGHVSTIPNLARLNVGSPLITDAGLEAFQPPPKLLSLNLVCPSVSSNAVEALRERFPLIKVESPSTGTQSETIEEAEAASD